MDPERMEGMLVSFLPEGFEGRFDVGHFKFTIWRRGRPEFKCYVTGEVLRWANDQDSAPLRRVLILLACDVDKKIQVATN